MTPLAALSEEFETLQVSLTRDDPPFRLQRRLGLIPAEGTGVVRRAVFWSLVTWLPLMVWALLNGRVLPGTEGEALLRHFAVHARSLIGIPLLHFAEPVASRVLEWVLPHIVTSGLVPASAVPAFKDALRDTARRRESLLPWLLIMALALTSAFYSLTGPALDELAWARNPDGGLAFGGWWLVFGRTVFLVLLAGWLWRVALVFLLFRRLSGIGLSVVPTHADRLAGLGFLTRVPGMFAPVIFAVSAVLAANWGHQVMYHGLHVMALRASMVTLAVVVLIVFLAPNIAFAGLLTRTKRQAVLEYSTLVGRQGRLVRQRWVEGQPVEDPGVLSAPELGPVADMNSLYEVVAGMRGVPVGLGTVASVLVPLVIPLLPVLAIEIPVKDLLKGLLKGLL